MRKMLAAVLAFTAIAAGASAWAGEGRAKVGMTVLSDISSPHPVAGKLWRQEVECAGAAFVKLHAAYIDLGPEDIFLLFDGDGREVYSQVGDCGTDRWLPSVSGGRATMEVWPAEGSAPWGVQIDRVAVGEADGASRIESICGANDMKNPACYDGARQAAGDAVGWMLFEDGGDWYYCTGSLVSENSHFLTNNHCISSQLSALSLEVKWMYQSANCGGGGYSYDTMSTGSNLIATDGELDFTLLQLTGDSPALRYGYLNISGRQVEAGEQIWIPQHPGGGPKRFAVDSDMDSGVAKVQLASVAGNAPGTDIGYYADTEPGSSGSPVLDAEDTVVALHHFGTGGAPCASYNMNQGVKMSLIYPLIAPYCAVCEGTPPAVSYVKYLPAYKKMKLTGSGFTPSSMIMINGALVKTVYKGPTAINALKVQKIPKGSNATVVVFEPSTGCSSEPFVYHRP